MLDNTNSFGNFIKNLSGRRDVGLVVIGNENDIQTIRKELTDEAFNEADYAFSLLDHKKVFSFVHKDYKFFYDFAIQYPTGQIEIFDEKLMKGQIFSPKYTEQSVVFIILKESLENLQKQGMDFFKATDYIYQY